MSKIADIDSMISISQRVEALRAENAGFREAGNRMAKSLDFMLSEHDRMQAEDEQLRSKLAEHELLFAIALENDRTLQAIILGIARLLPGVEATAVGIVGAVQDKITELRRECGQHAIERLTLESAVLKELRLLSDSQFSLAVIANLRAALSRIVAAIPGQGRIPDVIDGPWTDSIVAAVARLSVAEAVRDDARAASQRRRFDPNLVELEAQQRAPHPHAPEKCPACNWVNTNLMNYGEPSKPLWRCHSCAALDMRRVGDLDATIREHADRYEKLRANRDQLTVRRDELLATIARLSNTVPFPEEFATWESQRAKLIAEVGSLRSQVKFLSDDQLRLIRERDNTKANYDSVARNLVAAIEQKDAAHTERDALRAQLAVQPVRMNTSTVNIVDSGKPQPQHSTECGTAYRGCSPHCAFALAQVEEGDDPCLVEGGRREDEAL